MEISGYFHPSRAPGQENKSVYETVMHRKCRFNQDHLYVIIKVCGIYELDPCLLLASHSV